MNARFAPLMLALTLALTACAANEERRQQVEAVDDFVKVNELESARSIALRNRESYDHEMLGDEYALVETRGGWHLVRFTMRCTSFYDNRPDPDIRRNAGMLAAGEDTIRGCRIKDIYPIDEAQAEELRQIGTAPGET